MISQKYKENQDIVVKGDIGSSYYIIQEGTVSVLNEEKEVRRLTKGEAFGEQALYFNSTRTMSIKAVTETICLALARDTLTQVLGDQIQVIVYKNLQKWAIEKSRMLSKLRPMQMEKVLELMEIITFKEEELIFQKGAQKNPMMIICLDGTIRKQTSKEVLCGKGKIVGEDYLTNRGKDIKLTDGIMADKGTIIAKLSTETFKAKFGFFLDDLVLRTEKENVEDKEKEEEEKRQWKTEASKIEFSELKVIKDIGSGQFGNVFLVKAGSEFYALKCVSKAMVMDQGIESHIRQERAALESIHFPLIMKFIKTFTDRHQVYFLTEFIRGLELFDVIRQIGLLDKNDTQFYIGSFILCLEYLHSQYVVYRDLKPENVMIGHDGQVKLIDMGTAKFLKGTKGYVQNKTYTIIGTPHYMAPEVLSGKGYNFYADLWSMGICMFEFMCGLVPFGEEEEDPYSIYKLIMKAEAIEYPNYFNDASGKLLINQLLSKIQEVRLGPSFSALKNNQWFQGLDWDKLIRGQLKPPYTPPEDKMVDLKETSKCRFVSEVVDEMIAKKKIIPLSEARSIDFDSKFNSTT